MSYRHKTTERNKGNKPAKSVKHFGVWYALSVKKNLPIIAIFSLIALATLHRGGISFQTHLLWVIGLFPIALLAYAQKEKRGATIPTPLLGMLLLLLLSITAGWLTSTMADFGFITVTTFFAGVTTLLIGSQIDTTSKNIDRLFGALVVLTSGLSLFGLILYASTPADRLASTFAQLPYIVTSYPNAFALLLITLLPYTLLKFGATFRTPNLATKKEKATWIIAGVLNLSSLFLTFSRGGLIVGALIIAGLIYRKKLPLKKPLLILIVATIAITSVTQMIRSQQFETNEFIEKITLQSDEKAASVNERVTFWKGSLELIKTRPLQGFGPDTFEFTFPHYQKEPLANAEHPHNMFLKQAVEFGVPSAILYLAIIMYVLLLGYRHYQKEEDADDVTIALMAGALGIIAHNLIDYNLNFTSSAILFWLILGIIIGRNTEDRGGSMSHSSTLRTPQRITKSITIILALIICIGGAYEIHQRKMIVTTRSLTSNMEYDAAEKIFEDIHPLFFEDAVLLRGNNARDTNDLALANRLYSEVAKRNLLYAEAFDAWSQILVLGRNLHDAELVSQQSLRLDSLNHLQYHLNFMKIKALLGKDMGEPQIASATASLKKYLSLLKANVHNTVTTGNPSSAIKMTYLLEKMTKSAEMKAEIVGLRKSLTETAMRERKKYFAMFNIPLSPL